MTKAMPLAEAVRAHVREGMHLHFASTPSRSNAAVREVARAFRGKSPGFVLSTTGFHSMAHLLPMLRLGRRYIACFFGDNYPVPRPNALYTEIVKEGAELEHWSVWSYVSALRAGALGHTCAPIGSLSGTTLGEELAALRKFVEVPDPLHAGRTLGLVAAMRPDITFVHAAWADAEGHVVSTAPTSEGFWGALGATCGVIVTVEQMVDREVTRRTPEAIRIPPDRILAVCCEPFGAHPQPLFGTALLGTPTYADDFDHYELWRAMASGSDAFRRFEAEVLSASDGSAGYRAFVGAGRLEVRRRPARADIASHPGSPARREPEDRSTRDHAAPATDAPALALTAHASESPSERLVLLGARRIAALVQEEGYRTLLAGIGHSFLAARLAKQWLAAQGTRVEVIVETGILDIECGPGADEFLLSFETMAGARRLSCVEDALGTLTCGAGNRCLGVIGAAQIDARGDINSTRLRDGRMLVGSGGANDIASSAAETVVLTHCDRSRLVEHVDYVTSPGRRIRFVVTDRGTLHRKEPGVTTWTMTDLYREHEDQPLPHALHALRERCPWKVEPAEGAGFAAPFSVEERRSIEALDGERRRRRAG